MRFKRRWCTCNGASRMKSIEHVTGPGIQHKKITFTRAGEYDAAARNSQPSNHRSLHASLPFLLPRGRVESTNPAAPLLNRVKCKGSSQIGGVFEKMSFRKPFLAAPVC